VGRLTECQQLVRRTDVLTDVLAHVVRSYR
jgi:hypothetical protein